MDPGIHASVRTLLRAAVLVCAVLVGGLLSIVYEDPADVRAWVGAALALVTGGLVGRAHLLVRRVREPGRTT
ncbi:hypothetical protein [Actinomycetospora sp. CA-084318]|uniref:hypothetical protein n=1 Tax=Actinomycetospora sp. CA-084318 TaxID=3239892 RepID=UPI003D97D842